MNKITKAWTYGVAYLSLAVGSGVSISGNIADTYRPSTGTKRPVDGLDIAISAFWPAAVLLAIEMFVSRLWPRTKPMQAVRWIGSLGIGFVAMYVSWHHLADLMTSRGQDGVVSTIGPLAIDGLAIMATGLILSSRGHKIMDMAIPTPPPATLAMDMDMAQDFGPLFADISDDDFNEWARELDVDMASTTQPEEPLDIRPVSPAPMSADKIPATAVELFTAWDNADGLERPKIGDMYELVAGAHGKNPRTARRWYSALKASA